MPRKALKIMSISLSLYAVILATVLLVVAQAAQCLFLVPLATTKNGYDTGISVINLSDTDPLVISRVEYRDAADTTKNVSFGFGQVIQPGLRFSWLMSEVGGGALRERDGYMIVHVINSPGAKYAVWWASIDSLGFTNPFPAAETTCRQIR